MTSRAEFVFNDGGMNLLSSSALRQISAALPDSNTSLWIFRSGRPGLFAAGADMAEMLRFTPSDAAAFSELGQTLFATIERLPSITVALIDGDCFGGALDLVLAFDLRFATPAPASPTPAPAWASSPVSAARRAGARSSTAARRISCSSRTACCLPRRRCRSASWTASRSLMTRNWRASKRWICGWSSSAHRSSLITHRSYKLRPAWKHWKRTSIPPRMTSRPTRSGSSRSSTN